MTASTLLIIVIVIVLLGGGTLGTRLDWGTTEYGGLGFIVVLLLVLLLTGVIG